MTIRATSSRPIVENVGDYNSYRFLYPPRPSQKIYDLDGPGLISPLLRRERQGYWAQYKKNGTSNEMAISPEREIIARQRQNIPHKLWAPSKHTRDAFRDLPGTGWYYFVAELLQSKVKNGAAKGLTDINYIHEILVADGRSLTGTTFEFRQALLADLFHASKLPVAASGSHYVIDRHTWLARNHTKGFLSMFRNLSSPEDEGLVLKLPSAILAPCTTESSNSAWQVKIRVPTANSNYDS